MMDKHDSILVAGAHGMVGAAICRELLVHGYDRLLAPPRAHCDFEDRDATKAFFDRNTPDYVFVAAARVGGIKANNIYPAEFIYRNLMIEVNLIHESWMHRVKRLLFLGSTCIYPRHADQPVVEEALLSGTLEPTNEPYAIAKIAGIKLCEAYNRQYGTDFRSLMPTNLYGQGDNFHLEDSHVLPAMIRKFHEAKQAGQATVTLWGSGNVYRDFLCVDDLASASLFAMNMPEDRLHREITPMNSHINVGSGREVSIREVAGIVSEAVGYTGEIVWDESMPDGTPRKLTDNSKMSRLGWSPRISLEDGIRQTYDWYCRNQKNVRR